MRTLSPWATALVPFLLAAPLAAAPLLVAPVPGDCNGNGIDDALELSPDCDGNGVLDECESLPDLDGHGVPDVCEDDCNGNGVTDVIELLLGLEDDCDGNLVLDVCDLVTGAIDCDANGVPDVCEPDCDGDGLTDACEPDCNANGTPDDCDLLGGAPDCDGNQIPDECDLASGAEDCNGNAVPDDCDRATGLVGTFGTLGAGLAGTGGFVPQIASAGCPAVGFPFQIEITQGLGGAFGVLFVSSSQIAVPFVGGTLYVGPPVGTSIPHVLTGPTAGTGSATIPFQVPNAVPAGVTFWAQAGYLDAGAPQGYSLTSAVSVLLPTL